jgi:hypothetical protein
MNNVVVAPNFNTVETVESRLYRMKELKEAIRELQAEYEMLQKSTIDDYFYQRDTYQTNKGLILATYKEQLRTQFKTTEFKKVQPALYEEFLDVKQVKVFLLK